MLPAPGDHRLRVLIIDDSQFVRRVLRGVLEHSADFCVAGEAADGDDGLSRARELHPDVITLDLDMPRMNGMDMLRQLRQESDVAVVLVTGLPWLTAEQAREATELKVGGLVVKTFSSQSLDLSVFAAELADKLREAWEITQK